MFVHAHLHVHCAPELLSSLAATSPVTKYEAQYCKALKVLKSGVVFLVRMHKDMVKFNNKVKNVVFFILIMKAEV